MNSDTVTHYYNGPRTRAGKPAERLQGIPARDLTERDVARLSPEQVKALGTKGSNGKQLYTKSKPADAPKATPDASA